MARGLNNGIAIGLAILSAVTMMGSLARAGGDDVVLPQHGGEPVVMQLSAATAEHAIPSELLQVFVGAADPCCEGRTPIAGHYTLTDQTLMFSPAFGFDPGRDYVVRVWTRLDEHALVPFRLKFENDPVPAAVTEIYPSGETLPENVLRFYIHFSTPMAPHVAFDYVKLRDGSGAVDDAAFMRFKQELWNEDRTRLTVLMDPGRIKRNVATNVELGPALRAGNEYILSIEGGWPSADGTSVLSGFSKHFAVGDALRTLPDVKLWQATSPCLGSREPLIATFDRPFDRNLLIQDIRLVAEDGRVIEGSIDVGDGEHSWSFTPNEIWSPEKIQIVVNPELEDVAANNFRDLLDHVASEGTKVRSISLPIELIPCAN